MAQQTGLSKNAIRKRIKRRTLKFETRYSGTEGYRVVPESEVERIQQEINGTAPDPAGVKLEGDEAEVTSAPSTEYPDVDELLRDRNLDPDDWEVERLTVNQWDSPNGEALKQLKVTVKRKRPILIHPAAMPVDYRRPLQPATCSSDKPELVVLVGDQQAPYHDKQLHEVFRQWLYDHKPSRGVLIGDTVDFPDISRHPENPEWHVTVQECINSGYLLLRDYVQASEGTEWVKLCGNHDERIRIRLLQYMTNLYNIRPADIPGNAALPAAMSIRNLMHLDSLGIKWVEPNGSYNHAQVKLSKNLAVRHGWVVKKGAGASALGTLEHLGYSVVVGHTHRQSLIHKTTHDIDGNPSTLAAAEAGCMCQIENGLGYTVAPDWQNGFATATIWPDGRFKLDLATYVNNTLYWRDKCYR